MNRTISITEKLLFLVLLIRPSLDLFTQLSITGTSLRINPAAFISLFILLLGAVYVWQMPRDEKASVLKHPLVIGLLIWIIPLSVWAVIPVLQHGMERIHGVREWIRLFSLLPLTLMVLHITQKTQNYTLLYAVMFSFVCPAVVGYVQWIFVQGDQIKNVQRISATFVHPNSFAFYVVLIIGLSYWRFRAGKQKVWSGFFFFVSLSLLISTFSFTGVIAFMTAVFVMMLGENKFLRMGAIICVVLFCIAFALTPTGCKRLQEEIHIENLDMIERTGKHTTSLTWRLVNWRFLYRQWKKSPLVGHGLDSTSRVNPMLNPEKSGSDAHNDYIRYAVETGVLGLALFLLMMMQTGRALYSSHLHAGSCASQKLLWTAAALYCAWLVGSTADNLITVTAYQYALWTIFACTCAHVSPPQETVS